MICTLGACLFIFGVNYIVSPLGLYNGGFVGIGQLVRYVAEQYFQLHLERVDLASIVYFLLNAPLFILAFQSMSQKFFWKTVYTVALQTVLLSVIPVPEHTFTEDILTACIVGGLVAGCGVGIILKAGSSGGGQDILGVYCALKYPGFSVGKITLLINFGVYGCCALLFNIETVVYSLIYTWIMSIVIDKLHEQNINSTAIIFTKNPGIDDYIIKEMNRGVTIWDGVGGYTKEKLKVAFVALSKYEVPKLKTKVAKFDENAFITVNENLPIYGNFIKHLDT